MWFEGFSDSSDSKDGLNLKLQVGIFKQKKHFGQNDWAQKRVLAYFYISIFHDEAHQLF